MFSHFLNRCALHHYIRPMSSPSRPHFDSHCHLFNANFVILEFGGILRDAIAGDYMRGPVDSDLSFPQALRAYRKDLDEWLEQTSKALVHGEKKNLQMLQQALRVTWQETDVRAIALTMDIYYMFADPVLAGERAVLHRRKASGIVQWLLGLWGRKLPFYETPGFAFQYRTMLSLQKQYPHELYPFLAIDPRRPGMIEAVLAGTLVSHQGPFYGIKLYPRLGVHPQCADLWPLYAWCEARRIPITTHADQIGFPPPALEKLTHMDQSDFGHPRHFVAILERHPDLVIDLAHFGMSNPQWAEQIAELIGDERLSGVYSDLACYTTPEVIVEFRKRFWTRPRVAERTLLGTDYDVFYLVTLGITIERYLENFSNTNVAEAFTQEELMQMRSVNARRFLGL